MQFDCLRPPIGYTDLDQDVSRRRFRVLDKNVEISVLVKDAGIEQFVFRVVAASSPAGLDKIAVRICVLWVFIEILHVRMGWRTIQVKIIFFDVLTVIALAIGQAEQPLLEDRVLAVPQGESETQPLMVIAKAGEAVLAPMVSAGASLIMREVIPGVAVVAIVLTYRPPLALAEIRSPLLPRHPVLARFVETNLFCRFPCHLLGLRRHDPLLEQISPEALFVLAGHHVFERCAKFRRGSGFGKLNRHSESASGRHSDIDQTLRLS